jgi:hypothetical protein
MKKDEDGTLWMFTGDEGIMDEEGYLRSMYLFCFFDLAWLTNVPQVVGRIKVSS